ncbi:MAG: hypothetical protein K2J84_02885 [Bacteroidaceae bacterium]|nr:hypothetical protein [Bacteroidaceae bacterium]
MAAPSPFPLHTDRVRLRRGILLFEISCQVEKEVETENAADTVEEMGTAQLVSQPQYTARIYKYKIDTDTTWH